VSLAPNTPVLIGAGVSTQRCDDPEQALDALDLMIAATEAAARDAAAPAALASLGYIAVPQGRWSYANPAPATWARRPRSPCWPAWACCSSP